MSEIMAFIFLFTLVFFAGEMRGYAEPSCVDAFLQRMALDLHRQYPKLATEPFVEFEQRRQQRLDGRVRPSSQPIDRIAAWLKVLERTHATARTNEVSLRRLREYYHRTHVLSESQIPESYFELRRRIAREQGRGDVQITAEQRRALAHNVVESQKNSLDAWIDYFLSDDTAHYPFALKVWAFSEVVRLGAFDPARGEFRRRSAGTTALFPELNREALAAVMDERVRNPNSRESFARAYSRAVAEFRERALAQAEAATQTQGVWVTYPQGSDPAQLVASLQEHTTGWCTASSATAQSQLQGGDFHVYYSRDARGNPTVPRIAIRMQGNRIAEVRGTAANQNLDPQIAGTSVLRDRLQGFGDEGVRYEQALQDMAELTRIERRSMNGEPLSPEDLRFLYEIDHPIEGFGYQSDPRIAEIRKTRNLRQDLATIAGVRDLSEALNLKNGSSQDRLRYILAMRAMERTGLSREVDSEFQTNLSRWLSDSSQSFDVRRAAAIEYLTAASDARRRPLPELLNAFTEPEQQTLIQNLMDTPSHRRIVLQNPAHLPAVMVRVRGLASVRAPLIGAYSQRFQTQIAHLLDNASLSNETVQRLIPKVVEALSSGRLSRLTEVLELAQTQAPSLTSWLEDQLAQSYVENQSNRATLIRDLTQGMTLENAALRRIAARVLESSNHAELRREPILAHLLELHQGGVSFEAGVRTWLENPHVDSGQKAEFLIAHFGASNGRYFSYEQAIPLEQRARVLAEIDRRSSINLYLQAARHRGIDRSAFNGVAVESFLYASPVFPAGRGRTFTMGEGAEAHDVTLTNETAMQATAVTQLQWFLLTGRNPSRFSAPEHADGDHVVINGVAMNANHPVERVSWNDVQEYITALNAQAERQGHRYRHRLPTEAEWEAHARAGSSTDYSFGNDARELAQNGWSNENSGDRTHAVALLRPNAAGLYDVHGNVWEWVQDRYGKLSNSAATNPTGSATGESRVLRGGSWLSFPGVLRSAWRDYVPPGARRDDVGFRLLRTLP